MTKLPRSRPTRATPRRKATAAKARSGGAKPQGSRAKPRASGAKAAAPAPSPRPFPTSEPAPGLPRLALDGVVEAAKLPVKVGAGLTLRALDAVARSLRRA